MAAKRISQETFDDVVQENIIEFGMDPEEALNEAIQQFESQGVDLSNIVKIVPSPASENGQEQKHMVLQILDCLQKAVIDADSSKVDESLVNFAKQCRLELSVRYLAAQKGAYPAVLAACRLASEERCSLLKALQALSALLEGQPDILDVPGQELLLRVLQESRDDADLTLAGVRCIRYACLKHEQNRQDLVKGGVLALLSEAIVRHGDRADVVREACSGLRIMTFDDDIRVPFGHAHDHARMIVVEHNGLGILIEAAKGKGSDSPGALARRPSWLSKNKVYRLLVLDHHTCLFLSFSHQKQACMLIRNLVSHTQDFSQPILEMGAEDLITEAREAHRDCDDVAKAALRDLGCKVELRELWTGQKGSLAR
ncbi:armadillo repeat-containing protein 6 [Notechis scutatus]|uniref:Armadillo repeat-containing protein 6 n=1 Tax=Notechis scutatus TaxID=8663 RepID=A0A6J1V8B3_9SAUR|nr:armadillo repeat-containing protein 6 [Notechis scutatus]